MKPLFTSCAAVLIGTTALLGGELQVALQPVTESLTQPLTYTQLPGGTALVVDQPGYVWRIDPDGTRPTEPILNLTDRLSPINHGAFDERGVLDLALHPDFDSNRRVYITYTAPRRASAPSDWDCTLRLSEFRLPSQKPLLIDPASERVVLEIDKPYSNHHSGRIAFGPDGLLYLSVGDGGNANDQGKRPESGNGQNLQTLLGKILRIDVNKAGSGTVYSIPSDNPFANGGAGLPEIYAYGLRNVWGLSFDRGGSHELFAADVGQNLFEEVDIITKGGNYGWSLKEGFVAFDAKSPNKPPGTVPATGARGESLIDPILQYRHPGAKKDPEAFGISITGGYVYRGKALPELAGRYVFGDWSRNWGLPQGVILAAQRPGTGSGRWSVSPVAVVQPQNFSGYVTGLGEGRDGELYLLTNGSNGLTPGKGRVWKLVPAH
jgi:glucose/arabinose dehydrogenase